MLGNGLNELYKLSFLPEETMSSDFSPPPSPVNYESKPSTSYLWQSFLPEYKVRDEPVILVCEEKDEGINDNNKEESYWLPLHRNQEKTVGDVLHEAMPQLDGWYKRSNGYGMQCSSFDSANKIAGNLRTVLGLSPAEVYVEQTGFGSFVMTSNVNDLPGLLATHKKELLEISDPDKGTHCFRP